jgi:hypothetical protein
MVQSLIWGRGKRFSFLQKYPYKLWDSSSLLFYGYWRIFSPGVKQLRREVDHSPHSSVEVKNTYVLVCLSVKVDKNRYGRKQIFRPHVWPKEMEMCFSFSFLWGRCCGLCTGDQLFWLQLSAKIVLQININCNIYCHHHHHVHERLGMFPVP